MVVLAILTYSSFISLHRAYKKKTKKQGGYMSNNYKQLDCMYKYKSVTTGRWYCTVVHGRPENGICDKCIKRKPHQLSQSDKMFFKMGYKIYMECDDFISYNKKFLKNWFKDIYINMHAQKVGYALYNKDWKKEICGNVLDYKGLSFDELQAINKYIEEKRQGGVNGK